MALVAATVRCYIALRSNLCAKRLEDTMKTPIAVKYACVDGMHFFTAGDASSKGLCVGHKDLTVAYHEVGSQLAKLLEKNVKRKSSPKPMIPLEVFKAWLEKAAQEVDHIQPLPAALVNWDTQREAA